MLCVCLRLVSNSKGIFVSALRISRYNGRIIGPRRLINMISVPEYNRICWASRRGMLELDLILVPFVENCFLKLPDENQQRYVQLLESDDTDLFSWFLGRQSPENPEFINIVELIVSFSKSSANADEFIAERFS
ncbi:MAG: antitoxin CptB [Oceanicoccus sp.]|jgi:antitoxin CptB